eukprot:TRINITY_DN17447_c0_g1_i1.p1 TRINITY_DN17447_c0_g1~~TRINITY_DN17447_c0_g1_i1.p1  ORF type:complete len:150 (+),score=9.74 TRINITY_DN17447_c0_g1_i1:140-589(+)
MCIRDSLYILSFHAPPTFDKTEQQHFNKCKNFSLNPSLCDNDNENLIATFQVDSMYNLLLFSTIYFSIKSENNLLTYANYNIKYKTTLYRNDELIFMNQEFNKTLTCNTPELCKPIQFLYLTTIMPGQYTALLSYEKNPNILSNLTYTN